jgi:hypothetical protein
MERERRLGKRRRRLRGWKAKKVFERCYGFLLERSLSHIGRSAFELSSSVALHLSCTCTKCKHEYHFLTPMHVVLDYE